MENQDDKNLDPTRFRRDADVTSESIEVEPGERVEIVLAPERAMRSPILRMSSSRRDSRVLVEQVMHGRVPIFREDREVENFHQGRLTNLTVTASEPIKIVIVNTSNGRTIVGASLTESGTPTPELLPAGMPRAGAASTAYRLKNLQPENLRPNLKPEDFLKPSDPRSADEIAKIIDPKE